MKTALKYDDFEWVCGDVPELLKRCWSDDATFVRKLEPLLKREWQQAGHGAAAYLLRRISDKISAARWVSTRRSKDSMREQVLVGIAAYARAYMDILGDGWEPEAAAQLEAAFRRVGKALGDERLLGILWDTEKLGIITSLVDVRERGVMR